MNDTPSQSLPHLRFTEIPVLPDTKRPAITGWLDTPYGTSRYNERPTGQRGHVCSEISRLPVIDADKPEAWPDSKAGRLLGSAATMRNPANGHWHLYLDALGYTGPWPKQGPTVWGDIKSNGFVRTTPAYQPASDPVMIPLTAEIVAAIDADRVSAPGGPGTPNGSTAGDWHDDDYEITGDSQLTADIASMVAGGLEDDEISERLEVILTPLADPWSESQIQVKIASARRKGMDANYRRNESLAEMKDALPGPVYEAQSAPQAPGRRLTVRKASGVTMRRVSWLWEPYVPRGFITLLAGMEKSGKTQLGCNLAARLTTAGQAVVMLCPEDPADIMTTPRLVAAGANTDLCHLVECEAGSITIKADLDELGLIVAETGAALVIIDPIADVLSDETDNDKFADVGRELGRLAAWAEATGVAVLAVAHLRKASDGSALNKVLGSKAFTTKPRSVIQTFHHPEDPDMRLLTHTACNVAATGVTLGYKITGQSVTAGGVTVDTSRIEWCGALEMFSADSLAAAATRPAGRPSKSVECAEWVASYLRTRGGYALTTQVRAAAMTAGYGSKLLASGELKTIGQFAAQADYGKPTVHYWALLDDEGNALTPPIGTIAAWRGEVRPPTPEQEELISRLAGGDSLYRHLGGGVVLGDGRPYASTTTPPLCGYARKQPISPLESDPPEHPGSGRGMLTVTTELHWPDTSAPQTGCSRPRALTTKITGDDRHGYP